MVVALYVKFAVVREPFLAQPVVVFGIHLAWKHICQKAWRWNCQPIWSSMLYQNILRLLYFVDCAHSGLLVFADCVAFVSKQFDKCGLVRMM